MSQGSKVLIFNRDESHSEMLANDLNQFGYIIKSCATLDEFRVQLRSFNAEFVIIEVFADEYESFLMIQEIRAIDILRSIPVLVIMEREDVTEKINVLKMGADNVLCRPIRLEELTTKMQALLRRASNTEYKTEPIVYKNIKLSPLSGEVFINNDLLSFTETEFKLLLALILEKGRPVRRESLALRTLSSRNNNVRTIDVHINSIRNKLGEAGVNIKTLRGRGYMLIV